MIQVSFRKDNSAQELSSDGRSAANHQKETGTFFVEEAGGP
jgi:hypothetical protein